MSHFSEANAELKAQNSDIQLQLDHKNATSTEKVGELNKKIESMQSRHEQRIASMKKEQLCEL